MTTPTQPKVAWRLLIDDEGNDAMGKVTTIPEANTILGRLKAIEDALGGGSSGGLTDDELRASDVKVSLDGEAVAVTGPLTDAQIRASDVNVSLDGESVAVTGPLTDAQMRASDVNVSLDGESVAVTGPLTNAELRAVAVPASLPEVTVTTVCGQASDSGNNTIVASPAEGYRLVILDFVIQNASDTPSTGIIRSAERTNGFRILAQNQGEGLAKEFGYPNYWKLAANDYLCLNLSAAVAWNYSVRYYTEAV